MIVKLRVGGGSKNCVAWKVEKAVHFFVHIDKVTTDFFYGLAKKEPQIQCLA